MLDGQPLSQLAILGLGLDRRLSQDGLGLGQELDGRIARQALKGKQICW